MPYSPTHRFVHVAIPKTGTTSMIGALWTLHERDGGSLELVDEPVTSEFRSKYGLDSLGDRQPGRAKHLSAAQLQLVLGEAEYAACFSFTVVRNPWERMVSRYNFDHIRNRPPPEERVRGGTSRSFHDLEFEPWLERVWLRWRDGNGQRSQLSKLTDRDGDLLVDHVGRMSDLQGTMDRLCGEVGVDAVRMDTANASARSMSYADYYDERTRGMVAQIHRTDIEHFGFTFEELEESAPPRDLREC